jgi:hypothetical protein
VKTKLVTITPKLAQEWLDNRAPNRPLKEWRARQFARDIGDGRWELNGETIKFDDEDKLIDGQHRCLAVILAGKPIQSCAVYGLDSTKAYPTIDGGKARSLSDVLAKCGEKYYANLAGAVRWVWKFKTGNINNFSKPGNQEALEFLAEHGAVREHLEIGFKVKHLIPASMAVALKYLMAQNNPRIAEAFWIGVADGENLKKDDPKTNAIWLLRKRLVETQRDRSRLRCWETWWLIIRAWNCMKSGKIVARLGGPDKGNENSDNVEIL